MRIFLTISLAIIFVSGPIVLAQVVRDPITVLDLGMGARALGMGGAFTSIAEDTASLFYNPAGLALIESANLEGYAARPFDVYNHLALGITAPQLGIGMVQYGLQNISKPNEFGNPTGETFSYLSRAGLIGGGTLRVPGFALGATLKALIEDNGPVRGSGWGLDVGVLYEQSGFRLGLVAGNVLSDDVEYSNGDVMLWHNFMRGGVSYTSELSGTSTFCIAVDGEFKNDVLAFHIGAELWLDALGLRMGWDRGLWTAGASVRQDDVAVHMAYSMHDVLPQTLRLSASMNF
jgi:hypothetical protein